MINPAWRREPPTVDEVKEHSWWWNRPFGGNSPYILHLDTDVDGGIFDVDDPNLTEFAPDDWPGFWAPAIPPPLTDPALLAKLAEIQRMNEDMGAYEEEDEGR